MDREAVDSIHSRCEPLLLCHERFAGRIKLLLEITRPGGRGELAAWLLDDAIGGLIEQVERRGVKRDCGSAGESGRMATHLAGNGRGTGLNGR